MPEQLEVTLIARLRSCVATFWEWIRRGFRLILFLIAGLYLLMWGSAVFQNILALTLVTAAVMLVAVKGYRIFLKRRPAFVVVCCAVLALLWTRHIHYRIHRSQEIFTDLDVGLTAQDRETWHHTPEGSDIVPLTLLQALKDEQSGRPFIEIIGRFGFLPDPKNADGLPVGWALSIPEDGILKIPYVSFNCAACHTGQIEDRGTKLRIDGAPNMVDFEAFLHNLKVSMLGMMEDPIESFLFVRRFVQLNNKASAQGQVLDVPDDTVAFLARMKSDKDLKASSEADKQLARQIGSSFQKSISGQATAAASAPHDVPADPGGHVSRLIASFEKDKDYLKRRFDLLDRLQAAYSQQTGAGPGRADSFNAIRNLLLDQKFSVPMNAPVSIPNLFDYSTFTYIHWDANTTTVMDRNFAQAIAVGADFDPKTFRSVVRPREIARLEDAAAKIKPPKWPENIFGAINREQAARGAKLFQEQCYKCHQGERVFPADEIGTDPQRDTTFNSNVGDQPLSKILEEIGVRVKTVSYTELGISAAEARKMERPVKPEWRSTGGYNTRKLAGVWATAPYLHNGSVPSFYDLLQPADKRPNAFAIGHREYDPKKVGYVQEVPSPVRIFTTRETGNKNIGHEFGATLSETNKWDLVEHLKTL